MSRVLFAIALRNLVAHKAKSLIVGSLVFFGTLLVIVGTALIDSVDVSMAQSITSSIAGHLQIYSKSARDELALFGSGFMGGDDFGHMRDFARLRHAVEDLDNVRAVVPMGLQMTTVMMGNEIDTVLAELRRAVAQGDRERIAIASEKIQDIASDLTIEVEKQLPIAADEQEIRGQLSDLQRVQQSDFWAELDADPQEALVFLDTRIAPLAADGRLLYLRNLGTDLQRFTSLFDRFEIVSGEMVPPGEPGFLFSNRVYERWIKHRVARALDQLDEGQRRMGRFELDPKLRDIARHLPRQYPRISYQLSPQDAAEVEERLREQLPGVEGDLNELLQAFLTIDEENLQSRYSFFYDEIAPRIQLYLVPLGEDITLRAITRSGYFKAVNVRVYGTYRFNGLETSDLAGAQNLVDMLTFRELYGVMTDETQSELHALRDDVGVEDVTREEAEEALFGGEDATVTETVQSAFDEVVIDRRESSEVLSGYTQSDIDEGLAISAAVLLEDPARLEQTRAAVRELADREGFDVQVVDWRSASGIVGQLVLVLRVVLYVAIFIIFAVALVIINNSMVMATMERVSEIGTMRAIGAQRSFVMVAFLIETTTLAVLAGCAAAVASLGLLTWLNAVGIPATSDVMVFLFSGSHLHPSATLSSFVIGFFTVLVVSLVSTLYPAVIATRIQPVVAMQTRE